MVRFRVRLLPVMPLMMPERVEKSSAQKRTVSIPGLSAP